MECPGLERAQVSREAQETTQLARGQGTRTPPVPPDIDHWKQGYSQATSLGFMLSGTRLLSRAGVGPRPFFSCHAWHGASTRESDVGWARSQGFLGGDMLKLAKRLLSDVSTGGEWRTFEAWGSAGGLGAKGAS